MHRQGLRFVLEKGVSRECGADVHDEIVYRSVSGVHDVGLVLKQVVDALYDTPFFLTHACVYL